MFRIVFISTLFILSGSLSAQDNALYQKAHQDLQPRTITLAAGEYTVADILKQIETQTGNRVLDLRRDVRGDKIAVALDKATFWQALETIAQKAGCGFSPHHDDGVVLTDTPLRKQPVSHHGIFRFALQRIQLVRDDALGSHWCHVTVEMMWEPRFDPLLYDLTRADAEFAPDAQGKTTRGKTGSGDRTPVRGRKAVELEMRFPAPARSAPTLAKLDGSVMLQGPSRMLTFDFDALRPLGKDDEPRRLTQEGVTVSLMRVHPLSSVWTMHLAVKSPPPQGRPFESHQADLRWTGNSVLLHQTIAGKRLEWQPTRIQQGDLPDWLVCPFRDVQDKRLGDWSLTCRVPGVIVEVSVPFHFADVPLP